MNTTLKWPFFSMLMGLLITCSQPTPKNMEMVKIGPDVSADLVIYFKQGSNDKQINQFTDDIIWEPRPDGRGNAFRNGIRGFLRLLPSQANNHEAMTITFHDNATEQDRRTVKESMQSNVIVYKVFENIAPKDIKESDLK
jgi:hypothetical protein